MKIFTFKTFLFLLTIFVTLQIGINEGRKEKKHKIKELTVKLAAQRLEISKRARCCLALLPNGSNFNDSLRVEIGMDN